MLLQFKHFNTLLKRLGIILAVFTFLRLLFYIFNYSRFGAIALHEVLPIMAGGLRFDIAAIIYFNSVVIFLHLLPLPLRQKKWYQVAIKIAFYLFNSLALIIAIADFEYYQFNNKRITFDVLSIANEGHGMFIQYLKDFWHLYLILIIFLASIEFFYRKTSKPYSNFKEKFGMQLLIFFCSILLGIYGVRSSLGLKPISPIVASDYAVIRKAPLVTNSPFTFIFSIGQRNLDEKTYFTPGDEKKYFRLTKKYHSNLPENRRNVVVIIVESLSTEFIGSLNGYKGYTPFLDSLIGKSLVFRNATSNSERSNKGITCVLSSLPSFMNESFVESVYQDNCITGIGTCLKEMGYNTSFFHGGTNGTMNFTSLCKATGIDCYYGRTEFNNDKFFDGRWGIYDEEFLQYFVTNLGKFREPFFSAVFTLSSHHPFSLPLAFQNRFPKGPVKVLESMGYTDYALKRFFDVASKKPWFKNTLFVLTADHPFEADNHYLAEYNHPARKYAIPIIFYKPDEIKQKVNFRVVDQIDILPSILDFVGYPKCFKAFGKSVFSDTIQEFGFQTWGPNYQLFDSSNILYFDGNKTLGLYNYKNDIEDKRNLADIDTIKRAAFENYIKALVQTYNNTLIHNNYCGCNN
jgi:phosphoglycerol transferase MdoB-like AlkP superfamily enzyme